MSSHRVTAILVLHDGATWLPEVVTSLTSQSRAVDSIIAVDTGSLDSSAKLVQGARIPVLTLERDAGFGEAILHAVNKLPDHLPETTEWLWIIHDDLSLSPQALENLLNEVQNRPNVAMAGPKLLGWHDRTHLLEIGISIAANGRRWTNLEPTEYDQGQRDGVHEVLSVSTAGALIRRDIFEKLGGFDKNLDLFRDDVDLGWRIHTAGFSVISVSGAVGFHAEASANERRSVDVAEAFLHRPLLLDRRNAAYVLLVNSSWWRLPLLTLALLAASIFRSIGYLFAKLPGYASDEVLAVAAIFLQPRDLVVARRLRRKERLLPASVALKFIPSRWSQLRQTFAHGAEWLRNQIFPSQISEVQDVSLLAETTDDDYLSAPATKRNWLSLLQRPLFAVSLFILIFSTLWSRNRFGAISGGALPEQPSGVSDLWNLYFSGWQSISMGTSNSASPWIAIVAVLGTPFLGSVKFFISTLFFFAPLLMAHSIYQLLKRASENRWLISIASVLYALSPISISAINSGRLSTVFILILAPIYLISFKNWLEIETSSWRRIFALSLFTSIFFAFSPVIFLIGILLTFYTVILDYSASERGINVVLFNSRLARRLTLLFLPILICAPWSLELIVNPWKYFIDAGFLIPGGGPNWTLGLNPGGVGSLPWYFLSPLTAVLIISLFSTSKARFVAEMGFVTFFISILLSAMAATGNGTSVATRLYPGTPIALTTIAAVLASVLLLDKLKVRLAQSHVNIRHISVAFLLFITGIYALLTTGWVISNGATSPLQNRVEVVLPAFLAVESDAKTLVIRTSPDTEDVELNFYLARGGDATLGQPDLAPQARVEITDAVREIADGSGLNASTTFAVNGIKYLFLKSPTDENLVRIVDGLGGFTRASSTTSGIVWKVVGTTGQYIFTDLDGKISILSVNQENSEVNVSVPGTIMITENYSRGWRAIQDGVRLQQTQNLNSLPTFTVEKPGTINIFYDGTIRRAWVSLNLIVLITVLVLALPAGRRRREIEDSLLT